MIRPETLQLLRCPEDRTPLVLAEVALVERLNQAIAAGKICNRLGQAVTCRLDGALVRQDGRVAYPIIDEIPVLLADEAIALEQLDASPAAG